MNTKLKPLCVTASLLVLLATCGTAGAVPTLGPMYPPPGGVTFGTSGAASAGDWLGVNFHFSAFTPAAFTELYWGPQSFSAVRAGLDGGLHQLNFLGISSTTAYWRGTSNWYNPTTQQWWYNRDVELRINISGLGTNPWTTTAGGTVSGAGVGAVVDNSLGLNFVANLQFWGNADRGWQNLNSILQYPSGGPYAVSDFSGGFFATPANPIPEPGTLILLGLGLSCMGFIKRRRR